MKIVLFTLCNILTSPTRPTDRLSKVKPWLYTGTLKLIGEINSKLLHFFFNQVTVSSLMCTVFSECMHKRFPHVTTLETPASKHAKDPNLVLLHFLMRTIERGEKSVKFSSLLMKYFRFYHIVKVTEDILHSSENSVQLVK